MWGATSSSTLPSDSPSSSDAPASASPSLPLSCAANSSSLYSSRSSRSIVVKSCRWLPLMLGTRGAETQAPWPPPLAAARQWAQRVLRLCC